MTFRITLCTVVVALLACSGTATDTAPADVAPPPPPVQPAPAEPEPLPPVEGYHYLPGTPPRYSTFEVGDALVIGVDGAKLRRAPSADAEIVTELPHGQPVAVLSTRPDPVELIGRTNQWVEVTTPDEVTGYLFGSLLTPIGGKGFSEQVGDFWWTVGWSRDFKPLVRMTPVDGDGKTLSLVVETTTRFKGGTLTANEAMWGDFDSLFQISQCAVGERFLDGPQCATASVLVEGDKLSQRTPPDVWRFAPEAGDGMPCGSGEVLGADPLETPTLVRTLTLPSYLRGPSSQVACRQIGRITKPSFKGGALIACATDDGGKGDRPTQSTAWFVQHQPDQWHRLACMGERDTALEEALSFHKITVRDGGNRTVGGRFAPVPQTLIATQRGKVTEPHHWPNPWSDVLPIKAFDNDEVGTVYRSAANAGGGLAPSGLLVPRLEGGFVQYAVVPDLTGLTLDGVPSPPTYRSGDEGYGDYYAYGVERSDLTKVGKAAGGDLYTLRDGHPFLQTLREMYSHQAKTHEAGPHTWLFIEAPTGGFYTLTEEAMVRPLAAEPIVYVYADEPTPVSIRFGDDLDVNLTHPWTRDGWHVIAGPDGWLEVDGERFDRLFWDGFNGRFEPPEQGWVVRRPQLEGFLRETLPDLGLRGREVDEAIEAWMPSVGASPWVRVGVHSPAFVAKVFPLHITPPPDTLIRVLVELEPLEHPEPVVAPPLPRIERAGLTVVEWGYVVRM